MKTDANAAPPSFRRPIWARQTAWAAHFAQGLLKLGLRPNQVSVMSLVFSLGAAGSLMALPQVEAPWRVGLPLVAILCIALRGLCNLLDGMMAVEGGFRTRSGDLFNELPDRFSDSVTLLGLGCSGGLSGLGPTLGWAAALLAAIVAFTRVLGVQAGASAYFCGPMAKTARMAVVVVACVGLTAELLAGLPQRSAAFGLSVVIVGCLVTIARRSVLIVRELEGR
ncbi:MAG: CDP-alcohol phosphatidyltransferase family protein [Limisphaerales bacterium]